MPKAYMVVQYQSVAKPDAIAAYAKLAGPAVAGYGGRFIVRGTPVKTYEAGKMERTVVIEFPSVEKARAAYEGPEYAKALAVLGKDAAVRDMRIVEGAE
jgi:uncharacterized protein (DUF1330 family)